MPTSKVCGQCAACHKTLVPGERAVFFGHVQVVKDKLEPGGVTCIHNPTTACTVSHLHHQERCVICEECWVNIKSGYLRDDIDRHGCTPSCGEDYDPTGKSS